MPGPLDVGVAAAVAPVVLLGELPDKTMFAALVLASRGRPLAVWAGTAVAFAVHVAIAVTAGAALVALVPHRALQLAVGVALLAAGAVALVLAARGGGERPVAPAGIDARGAARVALAAAGVVFVAEWGDLTQLLVVELAARYHRPASVAVGAALGLWVAAGIAAVAGRGLGRLLDERLLRAATGAVLIGLGAWVLASAA